MTYINEWFVGRQAVNYPPVDAVRDLSAPGRADEAADYWVKRLKFDGPAWLIRDYLRGSGSYSTSELCDHRQNLRRLLWAWCCEIAETVGRNNLNPETVWSTTPLYLSR